MKRNEILRMLNKTYEVLNHSSGEIALEQALCLLASAPKDPESYLLMAEVAQENNQSEDALEWIEQGLSYHPAHVGLLVKKASVLLDDFEDVSEAFCLLSSLVTRFQKTSLAKSQIEFGHALVLDVLLLLIDCLRLKGELKTAFDYAVVAYNLAPAEDNAILALATAQFELGHFQESLNLIKACHEESLPVDFLRLKAYVLCAQGDFLSADKIFNESYQKSKYYYHRPIRFTEELFVQAIDQSLMALPREIRTLIETCAVVINDIVPLPIIKNSQGTISPQACVLIDVAKTGAEEKTTIITLFQKNIENLSAKKEEVKDIISSALLHELGKIIMPSSSSS